VVKIPHSRLNSFHVIPPCPFLARELRRYKRLQKFFDSLEIYQRNWIIEAIQSAKREDTRKRRARRAAEWLMEVMEAERDLPPAFKIAFACSPKATAHGKPATLITAVPRFTDLLPVRALFPAPKPFLH
jgi:bacteriocin resistance YdeI/OmpD-like protein